MRHAKPTSRKLKRPKTVLRLLDLEHSKSAVLNSLPAVSSQESYGHAIDEFIAWYCSEPRLAFTGPLCFGIDTFWNRTTLLLPPSMCALLPFVGLRMRPPTRAC